MTPTFLKVSVVLAAIMGCIDGEEIDRDALAPLTITAGFICEHRSGRHGP